MSKKTNYYKIGLFAIATFVILTGFLIFMGASSWFTPVQHAETYFDESVQGLEVGSPVKFRGVPIGQVEKIDVVNDIYGNGGLNPEGKDQRYIYVEFSLIPSSNPKTSREKALETFQNNVKDGLRISLATADLVGNVYLSINFQDPTKNPELPIDWTPKNIYIPSAKSTLSRFTDNLDKVFSELTEINYKEVITHFDKLVTVTTATLEDANTQQLGKQLEASLKQVGDLAQTIDELLSSDKSTQIADSIARDSQLLEQTLIDTSAAMKQLNAMMSRANELTSSQQQNLMDTMSYLKQMSSNLEVITNSIKNDPSSLIFGEPVPPVEPGK